jgi:hypothetical protein
MQGRICVQAGLCFVLLALTSDGRAAQLRFSEQGTFRIVQLTDIHLSDRSAEDTATLQVGSEGAGGSKTRTKLLKTAILA